MPSTKENKFIHDMIRVGLNDRAYYFQVYDTPLGHRWIDALKGNLKQQRILEKNFCFLGFADSKRDLNYLVGELNKSIAQINTFTFEPAYEKIHPFTADDFQYSSFLAIGKAVNGNEMATPGKRLKHASGLRGFDDFYNMQQKLEDEFPEIVGVRKAMKAFADRDFKPFDVHEANVMMRPRTNDIVIVDLGRFNM